VSWTGWQLAPNPGAIRKTLSLKRKKENDMAVIKNPNNLRPDVLKNRARNLRDAFMSRGEDKAAIRALQAEGFTGIAEEVKDHNEAYWNAAHSRHAEAVEKMKAIYEMIEEES
jgi:hypothetical protein